MSNLTITLTAAQARLVADALDTHARATCGHFEAVVHHAECHAKALPSAERNYAAIRNMCGHLRREVFGETGGWYGYASDKESDEAYLIQQAIERALGDYRRQCAPLRGLATEPEPEVEYG